jgi:hypothetical protein
LTGIDSQYKKTTLKIITLAFLQLLVATTSAQDFTYPVIKNDGSTIADFIPSGWVLHDSAGGDLNYDGERDLAIVLQHRDSVQILKQEESYTDTLITQPRMLVIFFRDSTTQTYRLMEQSNSFILNHDQPYREDPYQSIIILNGILHINFQLFYNNGSRYISNTTYKFRCRQNTFVLIGADNNSFNRGNMDFEDHSFNFPAKKWSITRGNDNTNQKVSVKWHSIKLRELKTLKTFKQPYTWEVVEGVYL